MSQTSPSKRGVSAYACVDFDSLFEDSMTNSSLYQVDLSSIKKCQDIRSGKELEKEAARISEALQDTSKCSLLVDACHYFTLIKLGAN